MELNQSKMYKYVKGTKNLPPGVRTHTAIVTSGF